MGCQAGHCCSPRRIKGAVFSKGFPEVGSFALEWPHPAHWGWAGSHQDLGSGVMWGLQGAALGDGCGVKVAEPWRARGRDGAAWLESCGSTLLSRG